MSTAVPRRPRTARRTSAVLGLGALLLVAGGCGASAKPQPVGPNPDAVPADLCSAIPQQLRSGLTADSSSEDGSSPTAACSLHSDVSAAKPVRLLVTWLAADDESAASDAYASQCRSFDRNSVKVDQSFAARGATKSCAASGSQGSEGSSVLVALRGRQVVVVRYDAATSAATALEKGQQALEGVLAKLAAQS